MSDSYFAALSRNTHLIKLPVFAELFKLPPSFRTDLLAFAEAMEARQAESLAKAISFHKNTTAFIMPYNVVLQFLNEKTAMRGTGGADWFRISKVPELECLMISSTDGTGLYHVTEAVRLNHAKCKIWRLWMSSNRERLASITRKRNGFLQLKFGDKGAYHRVLWQGEWSTNKEFVIPFPDGKGKAFQAAIASEALMHEHFTLTGDAKGVGIEVFAGQDIALVAALALAISRLNALGTTGAATSYVPSSLLGAFHYFSGGYSRGSEEAWQRFEARPHVHTAIALLKATHDVSKGQDDKLKCKEIGRICRAARPYFLSHKDIYELFVVAHEDDWATRLDRQFFHEQRAHKQSEARLEAAQMRLNSLIQPISNRPEDIRMYEAQRISAIRELEIATRELKPASPRTTSLTIYNPAQTPIPLFFGADPRAGGDREVIPPNGTSLSWMLMPGEMVQVLTPDSAMIMDRIIVGQWPLVLTVTHTGQLAVMQQLAP